MLAPALNKSSLTEWQEEIMPFLPFCAYPFPIKTSKLSEIGHFQAATVCDKNVNTTMVLEIWAKASLLLNVIFVISREICAELP